MDKVLFRETQKNIYLIIAFLVIGLFFGIMAVVQMGFHKTPGNHPAPAGLLIGVFAAGILGAVFFNYQSLKLIIITIEVRFSLGVLTGETVIRMSDVKSISIRKYDGLKEFGGWGARYSDTASCFTVSGNDGIEIVTAKERFLIGTHVPIKAQSVIDKLQSSVNLSA